ncbi:uncharacterized protein PV07_08599 [Cladophialophora immunda]|uniref:Uncharacterized protein n=1 Tax=Cladophialophora immunda TaxID=569365 RepID=A0A0D1ZCG6_9EURO|nr:uncharacterized protein PV07_08599 [Cladophialophora immunda]KIW25426.1 hypothetical protein PV07_08599 [Cladophialophora immunda]
MERWCGHQMVTGWPRDRGRLDVSRGREHASEADLGQRSLPHPRRHRLLLLLCLPRSCCVLSRPAKRRAHDIQYHVDAVCKAVPPERRDRGHSSRQRLTASCTADIGCL